MFSDEHPLLSSFARELFAGLYEELCALDQRISSLEERIRAVFQSQPLCHKIAAVEGVGPVTATAIVGAVADGKMFRNGRRFAAWLGLVPRQHSRWRQTAAAGNHEARRSVLTHVAHSWRSLGSFRCATKTDSRSRWIAEKKANWEQPKHVSQWQTRMRESFGRCWPETNRMGFSGAVFLDGLQDERSDGATGKTGSSRTHFIGGWAV